MANKVLGITESKGNYQGHDFHNFLIHVVSPSDHGIGEEVERYKLKQVQFIELLGAVKGDMKALIGRSVSPVYNRYGNIESLNLLD